MKRNVSICIPAYNEEQNIGHLLRALARQKTENITINKIVVVSSGSTDNTNQIVKIYASTYKNIFLIVEPERLGKAHAINTFLKKNTDSLIVIESADTIPSPYAVERLCLPLLKNDHIGMTGGAPVPVNDRSTFLGYIVHLWWWFHRNIPRFGEFIAFRSGLVHQISETTAVDEAYIQSKVLQQGYDVVHVNTAVVQNKGPERLNDLIVQRRRIYNGHTRLEQEEGIRISPMTNYTLYLLFFVYQFHSLQEVLYVFVGLIIECYAQCLGVIDKRLAKINPYIWEQAESTKHVTSPLPQKISQSRRQQKSLVRI